MESGKAIPPIQKSDAVSLPTRWIRPVAFGGETMNLFHYGLTFDEPNLDHLGSLELVHNPMMECGEWKYWIVCNFIDYWEDEFDVYLDHERWHRCRNYNFWPQLELNINEECILLNT